MNDRARAVRAVLLLLASGSVGCHGYGRIDFPPPKADWVDLSAYARPTILKNPEEPDHDLMGLRKELDERRATEAVRLSAQPKVSVTAVDLPVRDALGEISGKAKIPVVVDASVTGNVTLDVKEVPFETALRLITFSGGYAFSTDGYAYFVGSADPAGASYGTLTGSRVITTFSPPKLLAASLNKAFQPYLSFTEGINKLVLTGPASILDRLETEVRTIDRPPAQILIEAMVVETKTGDALNAGLDYSKLEANLVKTFMRDNDPSTFNLSKLDVITKLAATFDLLAAKNLATVRSHPKVVTTSGTSAEMRSIFDYYVVINQPGVTFVSAQLELITVGTTLKVTPVVTRNEEVELTVEPEVADVVGVNAQQSGGLPIVSRRAVKSTVRLKSGDVLVIGGLFEENTRDLVKGIPFLKDIPVLNLVTAKTEKLHNGSELLIFVSPKILK